MEATMTQEISALRERIESRVLGLENSVDARLASLEKWLERVTAAVERQAEARERLTAVEFRIGAHEIISSKQDERIKDVEVKCSSLKETIVRWTAGASVVVAVVTTIVPYILNKFLGH